jgi:hypothetical protein
MQHSLSPVSVLTTVQTPLQQSVPLVQALAAAAQHVPLEQALPEQQSESCAQPLSPFWMQAWHAPAVVSQIPEQHWEPLVQVTVLLFGMQQVPLGQVSPALQQMPPEQQAWVVGQQVVPPQQLPSQQLPLQSDWPLAHAQVPLWQV